MIADMIADTQPAPITIHARTYTAQPGQHCHDYYQLIFQHHGRLAMHINGADGAVGPASWGLIHPAMAHRFWADQANHFLVADLSVAYVAVPELLATVDPQQRPVYLPLTDRPAALFRALQTELALDSAGEPIVRDALAAYAGAVVATALNPRVPSQPEAAQRIVLRACEYLASHALTVRRISEIAAAVGVSERHLQRCFRAHLGTGVLGYLQQQRLREACRLLESSSLPIHAIAAAVGFESQSYFTRLFSRTFACSPARYRQSRRGGGIGDGQAGIGDGA